MAIKNITNEVEELRSAAALNNRISCLPEARAIFVLRALLAAGHVTEHTMEKALDLADTVSIT